MSTAARHGRMLAGRGGCRARADLFVLRRVMRRQFVHFGGSGRGEAGPGSSRSSLADEAPLADALSTERPCASTTTARGLVFGPYYAHGAVIVPVVPDLVVVFGAVDGDVDADDDALAAAAHAAVEAVEPPGRRSSSPTSSSCSRRSARRSRSRRRRVGGRDARRWRDVAAEALSCELGVVYLADGGRLERRRARLDARLLARRARGARCRRVLGDGELPVLRPGRERRAASGALADECGIRSYYLLELTGLARGVLLVAHTDAAPRGFTLLCRRLGAAARGGRLGRPRRRAHARVDARRGGSAASGVRRARRLTTASSSGAISSAITSNQM